MSIQVAVIGSGRWGKNHISTLDSISKSYGITKLLVCDSDKETLEQWHDSNYECFESISEMLKSHQPDFAVIATPPESHFSIAKQLMEKKINVLVEKPLSQNLDDANSLLDQSEESGCILSVGVLLRFHSGIMLAKNILSSGRIGDIVSLRFERHSTRHIPEYADLVDAMGIHAIDSILYLLGEKYPNQTILESAQKEDGKFASCAFSLKFDDNVSGEISIGWSFEQESRILQIIGTEGNIVVDFSDYESIKLLKDGKEEICLTQNNTPPLEAELIHMINSCEMQKNGEEAPLNQTRWSTITGVKWSQDAKQHLLNFPN